MKKEMIAKELLEVAKLLVGSVKTAEVDESELADLRQMKLSEIARLIRRDWRNVNFAARPYLDAMGSLSSVKDDYGYDSGSSIVAYFLSNARSWKGAVAKAVKKELNRRL